MALIFVTGAIGSYLTPKIREKFDDFKVIPIIILIYGSIWLIGPFLSMYVGGIFILIRSNLTGLYTNIQSIVLNRQLPSSKRATLLSVFSMLSTIPYVLLAYFIGSFIQKYSALWVGFILGIVCLLSLIFLSYLWKDKIFRKKI
jgi:MFS family permease